MTSLGMAGLWHPGLIVDDLDAAMAAYSDILAVEWASPKRNQTPVRGPQGIVERETWLTYSLGEGHHIELIWEVAGGVWSPASPQPRLHHMGFWVDDLQAESARLVAKGYALHLTGPAEEGALHFAYHDAKQGALFIELNMASNRPTVLDWVEPHRHDR